MQMCVRQGNVRFRVSKAISVTEGKIALRTGKSRSIPFLADAAWHHHLHAATARCDTRQKCFWAALLLLLQKQQRYVCWDFLVVIHIHVWAHFDCMLGTDSWEHHSLSFREEKSLEWGAWREPSTHQGAFEPGWFGIIIQTAFARLSDIPDYQKLAPWASTCLLWLRFQHNTITGCVITPQTGFVLGLLGSMAFVLFLLWFWGSWRVTTSVLHGWMQFVLCLPIHGSAK